MIKTITHRNNANVNRQLVSSFNEEIKRLNAEDYDYTRINTAFLQLEAYLKQLSARLGIDISISWSVSANGRAKLQLVNDSQRYNVQLKDLNQMFTGNFSAIADFIIQVETVYKTAANEFAKVQSTYNSEVSGYAEELSDLSNEYSELLAEAEEADLSPQDITEIIAEADESTKGELTNIEQAIEDALPTPPEGTIGSGVTGGKSTDELISDAQKAAEEAAQQAQERAEAEAGAKSAQEEADRAQAAADRAEAKASEAQSKVDDAKAAETSAEAAYNAAQAAADSAWAATNAGASISSNTGGFDYTSGTFVPGSYYDDSNNTAYQVSIDEEGNVTVSGTNTTSGATFTVTDVDNSLDGLNAMTNDLSNAYTAAETARDTAAENYSNAMNSRIDAEIEANNAAQAAAQAQQAANDAQAKADAAQQAADDANIPYASDDELENGWYNDDAEPEDTTEGNDDWGDWDGPSWDDGSVEL